MEKFNILFRHWTKETSGDCEENLNQKKGKLMLNQHL